MRIIRRSSVPVVLIGLLMVFAGCAAADRDNGDLDGGDGGTDLCETSADCDGDEKCLDGICRPADYCESDEHCGEGYYCNQINQTCVEAECESDSECKPGEYCDEYVCREYCEGVQCGVGERCNPDNGDCEPLPCTIGATCETDADCAPGLYCDPVAFGCTECPPEFFCNIHECFPVQLECRDHSDCDEEERCNPDTNKCEPYPETCEIDRDCTPRYCNLYTHECQVDPFLGDCESDEECHQAFGEEYYCHPRLYNCVLPLGEGECYDTADCDDPGLVCDLTANKCAPRGTVCGVDSDCEADHVCINGTCIYQCPPDRECADDNDCEYGDICRNGCCVEDKTCSSDYDCTYPEVCEDGWCQEPLPCAYDDGYEDNDDPTTAYAITLPALNQTEDHLDLVICSRDDDWYKIDVPAGAKLNVRINFLDSSGDLDMKLFDNEADATSGWSVDSSASVNDVEEVEYTAAADSTFYVQVYGYYGAENTYSMHVTHGEAGVSPCSPDDAYEENDAWTTATPISLPAVGNADLYQDMILCSGDEDWFAIEVPAGEGVNVRIDFVDADGDLEMKLYDSSLDQVDSSTSYSNDYEEVSCTRVSADATFYVEVYGYSGAENDYTMEVSNPGGVTIDCTDGGLEPNDTAQDATPVAAGEHTGLFICDTDPLDTDWYSVTVAAGGRLEASIAFDSDDGNLNLYLYESDGTTQVDSSTGYSSDTETVYGPRVTADTTFLINVVASSLTWAAPYTLTVVEHPPIDCSDGGYEPNDEAADATPIGAGDQTGLLICQTDPLDVDWYSLSILDGERLHFSIAFDHNQGDLNLYMYESDGTTQVDSSTGYSSDTEEVQSPRARGDSTYLVKVVPYSASYIYFDVTYDMSVTVDPPIVCNDDGWEPNDDFDHATALSLPGIDDMIMCPGDADIFAIDAVRTDRLNFLLVNESGLGDLDLYVYDSTGFEVGKSTSTGTGAENYSYDVYVDGTYFISVEPHSGDAEEIIDYHLDVSKETFTLCDTDAYEPNDNEQQATVLSDMQFSQSGSDWILELSGLHICKPGPEDWFALDLLQGDQVTVEIFFTNSDGDIDMYMYDPTGGTVDSSTTTGNTEVVTFSTGSAPADGRYYVRVYMYTSNKDNAYDLKVTADRDL